MKVLVACEESQEVCKAFRVLGHEAYSCDIEPCSGGHPEWHLQCDALEIIKMRWDLIIAHPPCTDLAVSGAAWFAEFLSTFPLRGTSHGIHVEVLRSQNFYPRSPCGERQVLL